MILYHALAIPPDDVRGIGIHITKLSVPGKGSVMPAAPAIPNLANGRARQVTLSPVVKKDAAGRPPALQHLPAPVRDPNAVVKREVAEEFGPLLLPPVHEVDADVYEALPQDLKDEMEQTYRRNEKREQDLLAQKKPENKV